MRFDYQLPLIHARIFRLSRHLRSIAAGCAVCCISISFVIKLSNEPNIHTEHALDFPEQLLPTSPIALQDEYSNLEKWQNHKVKSGDSLSSIFEYHHLPHQALQSVMQASPESRVLTSIHPGQTLQLLIDDNQDLKELKYRLSPSKILHVRHTQEGYKYFYEEKELIKKYGYSSGTIKESLYTTAQFAGLNDRLTMQLAEIFGWDVDFALDIRENDSFRVLYEEIYIDDKKIDTGNIVAAEFINHGRIYQAIRYTDHDGKVGYYSPEGFSMQKAFLRTPVKFTRISSKFSNGRKHPVLHRIRAHKGVDYAAPNGTPVKAAGDGKVHFIGNQGGYGNTLIIQHGRKYSTLYAHLHKFAAGLSCGQKVRQGQVIGFVGKTGLATGDHLHYEFRINGIHCDPLTVTLPKSDPIPRNIASQYRNYSANILKILDAHSGELRVARK